MQDRDNFNEFINELIDKNDILDVVRGYVDLTRKGNSYWGRCPFHHEKTASFHVEERMKIYKCFGCGAAGNVIKFIQEIESVSFMEAVKILADRVGMKVPEFSKRKEENFKEKKDIQDRHMALVQATARYYHSELIHSDKMMGYLLSHGIDKATITAYGLGYSTNYYGINSHLLGLGYTEKEIEDAGVCMTDTDGKFKDVMAGRIVCPHINTFGKVVGFAGSLRDGSTIYTKNTDIFRADSEVFGTHLLKAIKIEEGIDHLVVTSTPINAVALHAKGVKKVVSVMGSEITSKQSRALTRFTDKFTIAFSDVKNGLDKDYQGIDALAKDGASVKVASLIGHMNMLELIEKKTDLKFIGSLKRAKSLLEYQLKLLAKNYDLKTKDGKDAYIDLAKSYIMTLSERSKQEPYISVLSKIAGISEDSIRNSFYQDSDKSNGGVKRVSKRLGKEYNAYMTLLGLIASGYEIDEDLTCYLDGEYLEYYKAKTSGEEVNLSEYFNDAELKKIASVDIKDKNNSKVVSDCIKILKEAHIKKERDRLILMAENESDLEKRKAILMQLNELMRG